MPQHCMRSRGKLSISNSYTGKKKIKFCKILTFRASLVAQTMKTLPAVQQSWVQSLGQKDTLEKGMAIHSSILAQRIPRGHSSLVDYSP